MVKKSQGILLDRQVAEQIAQAISSYAYAAYPPGGSECAQASHQSLLDIADKVYQSSFGAELILKKRQLPMVKSAINWFYSDDNDHPSTTEVNPAELIATLSRS